MSTNLETNIEESEAPVSKRAKANRENAKKSTGAKTAEGKARSSQNAYKHGMRSKAATHPYEDRALFEERRQAFFASLAPTDIVEASLVDLIVATTWRLERSMICDTAILAEKAYKAVDLFDIDFQEEVKLQVRGLRSDPHRCARLLRCSSRGCTWIMEHCETLIESLVKRGYWYPSERDLALNICGLTTEDLFYDSLAFDIVEAFVKAGWSTEINGDMCRLQAVIRTPAPEGMASWEYRHRVDSLAIMTKEVDPEPSRAKLIKILRTVIEEVESRKPSMKAHEDYLRSLAADRTAVDTSPEGQLRMRYETMHRREMRTTLHDLHDYRKTKPENEIGEARSVYTPPGPAVPIAPNEAIWATVSKSAPMAEALDKSAHHASDATIPELEEESQEAKKPLGIPSKPLYELLSRTSPVPDELYRWADEVETERKQPKDQDE